MGYVGIPNALLFANDPDTDFVYGIQRKSPRSQHKINDMNNGIIPFDTYENEMDDLIGRALEQEKFTCTSNTSVINECDAVIISVQTPFKTKTEPDFEAIDSAVNDVAKNMYEDTLVSIESTVTPGYTVNFILPFIEKMSGFNKKDISLVHAPERVTPGKMLHNIRNIDRVIGGVDPVSTTMAAFLYKRIVTNARIIKTDATTAETIKTAENTFRDVQIAAINQLALYCEAIGVNVYNVRSGIDTLEGYGVTRSVLWPGAGVGGHCLTKDTYHLERGMRNGGSKLDFPDNTDSLYTTSRSINDFMPVHMRNLTENALKSVGKSLDNARIAILGLSYNHDSDDMRDTPTEKFCALFDHIPGAWTITIHDPYSMYYSGDLYVTNVMDTATHDTDAVLIFTSHKEYYYLNPVKLKSICKTDHPVIIDGRNVIDPDKFIECGFVYRGIGRGDKNNHPIIHCEDNK
jgi:UDP-N-acetyl-D-mannosaminuronic acid dehydrogenase